MIMSNMMLNEQGKVTHQVEHQTSTPFSLFTPYTCHSHDFECLLDLYLLSCFAIYQATIYSLSNLWYNPETPQRCGI